MKSAIVNRILLGALTMTLSAGAFAAGGGGVVAADPSKHFDAKGKMPSEFTLKLREMRKQALPLADTRDFDEAKRGFIAAPDYKQIMAEAGHVAWDMGSYANHGVGPRQLNDSRRISANNCVVSGLKRHFMALKTAR